MKKTEIKEVVKKIIDEWDPVFLYELGCPKNEYDLEITKISSLFVKEVNEPLLSNKIYEVFKEMFGDTSSKATNIEECNIIAKKILEQIK